MELDKPRIPRVRSSGTNRFPHSTELAILDAAPFLQSALSKRARTGKAPQPLASVTRITNMHSIEMRRALLFMEAFPCRSANWAGIRILHFQEFVIICCYRSR